MWLYNTFLLRLTSRRDGRVVLPVCSLVCASARLVWWRTPLVVHFPAALLGIAAGMLYRDGLGTPIGVRHLCLHRHIEWSPTAMSDCLLSVYCDVIGFGACAHVPASARD